MKYISLPKPNEKEIYRLNEILFYLLITELEKNKKEISQNLYGLSQLADVNSSLLILAATELQEVYKKPTQVELAAALAYYQIPIREITKKWMHHTTYYKHIYAYFDLDSSVPRLTNKLSEDMDVEIIKLLNYIRTTFNIYDIARKSIIYG